MVSSPPIPLYNRELGTLQQEQVYGQAAMDFLYGTVPGRLLTGKLLARPWVSEIYSLLSRRPSSRSKIERFVAQYGIDTTELKQDLTAFTDFNDFFIRELRPDARPMPPDPEILISPADGRLLAYHLQEETVLPIKGHSFTLTQLTANPNLAQSFVNGWCLVFRLAPVDYHRSIYIDNGTHGAHYRLPGVLHSVNPLALWQALPVFQENQREYCVLKTQHWGRILHIDVGALVVGKIHQHQPQGGSFSRGQEKGYFELGGSTIIQVFQPHRIQLDPDILEYSQKGIESLVKCGSRIGCRLAE